MYQRTLFTKPARVNQKAAIFRPATSHDLPACNCKTPPWEDCEHTSSDTDDEAAARLAWLLADPRS